MKTNDIIGEQAPHADKTKSQADFRDWHSTMKAYEEMTNNHPTIHSNRFPSWRELSTETQQEYIKEFKEKGKL